MLIAFDNIELHPVADEAHEFLLTSKEVAEGYGVTKDNIRNQKHRNGEELIEGKHFLSMQNLHDSNQKQTLWTKRGIIRLGFFIKSERAKKFRDFVEDLVLRTETVSALTLSPIMEDLLLRQNALLAEALHELRLTQEAVVDAKDETIQVQREAMEMLANVAPKNVTINQTTVRSKSYSVRMIDSGAEELFIGAVRMLLEEREDQTPQGEILVRLGKGKADKTALRWLHKYIGIYWDMSPIGKFNYFEPIKAIGGVA